MPQSFFLVETKIKANKSLLLTLQQAQQMYEKRFSFKASLLFLTN